MNAYYNEIDPYAADWLRNLISAGLIAPGEVDTRSIKDVQPSDVEGFTQCHFFAGIGGWSYALRLAGWPDDAPVWTGSCPCQPFSAAGKRKGTDDERHLWPEFRRLVAECRPAITFGEQVASKDGRHWLAGVRADLEGLGYAVGAADLCAAGAGAPHIRQRLFWVADANEPEFQREPSTWQQSQHEQDARASRLDISPSERDWATTDAGSDRESAGEWRECCARGSSSLGELVNSDGARRNARSAERQECGEARLAMPATGSEVCDWSDFAIIPCTDGKSRRIEPSSFPLAARIPRDMGQLLAELRTLEPDSKAARRLVASIRRNRTGRLKGYGNSIVPQVAAEFIAAFMESCE